MSPLAEIHYKPGVSFNKIDPVAIFILIVCAQVYAKHGVEELWITSITDGRHSSGSLHYKGRALDLRVHNIPAEKRGVIANEIASRLSPGFDVIYGAQFNHADHIHVEYDPS